MRVQTTSRHTKLTPAQKRFLEERLAKLERFAFVREASVVLASEKNRHSVEVRLKTHAKEFVCREESHDMLLSIDVAVGRLERQLKKVKDRRTTRLKHDGTRPDGDEALGAVRSAARVAVGSAAGLGARGKKAKPVDDDAPRLVPEAAPARRRTPEEARTELLSGDDAFLAFVNAETEELNLLYRRDDGQVGWLTRRARRRPRG
jgi:putative sigma-54 modulation protein